MATEATKTAVDECMDDLNECLDGADETGPRVFIGLIRRLCEAVAEETVKRVLAERGLQ